jgi:hypothetical protein
MDTKLVIVLLIIIVLLFIFRDQLLAKFNELKSTEVPVTKTEHLNDPKITEMNPPDQVSQTLDALGYTADAPWDEVLQATELDPSTYVNHMDFVKDVRRFSSGANFTSVTDDNTNLAFTNFVGLRRPEHVPIGPDARQQPDIDETVLQRNRNLRWN